MQLDATKPVRAGEELVLEPLSAYLRAHWAEAGDAPLLVEQFPEGYSNLTYLLRCGEKEFVLRRPPFGNEVKAAHDMGREFRVLSKLAPAFPSAPRPCIFCEDVSVLGAPFYVME